MTTRLHLIDGTFELFRAHFSKRPDHKTPEGKPFKAVAGLVSAMLYLLHEEEEAVSHIAIAFDNPIRSFRNDLFDGYKTEEGVDPDLLAQFDAAEEAMLALGMVVWSMDKYECDDALATGAARFRDRVDQTRILSPDKDLGQCITGDRVVTVDRLRKTVMNEDALKTRRGILPESIPDFLALVGDSADGIPGIAGFGEKGAAAILGKYTHLEAIPKRASEWAVPIRGADKLAATLAAEWENALLYRKLATLAIDVPLRESFEDLAFAGIPRAKFNAWCTQMNLQSMAERALRVV